MTLLGATTVVGGIILTKFMMSLRDENYRVLTGAAIDRGISVQELLRAVIIPDCVKETPRGIVADNWPSIRPRRRRKAKTPTYIDNRHFIKNNSKRQRERKYGKSSKL